MTTVSVHCIGLPVETHDREAPVEYDLTEACGWTGTTELADWCVCGDSVRLYNAMPGGCPDCGGALEIDRGTGTDDLQGGDAHASDRGVHVTGPAEVPSPAPAGPPDLHQAIQAATKAICWRLTWPRAQCEFAARVAVEAAWGVLTQPLADLHRDLDHTRWPEAWTATQAAELDHLATFEVAIRNALKPWTLSGIDADGKSYRDVVEQVGKAVADLDQARERTDG